MATQYGLWQERDIALDALAAEIDRDTLLDVQRETVATHNAELNKLIGIFADRVTMPQISVQTGATNRLQPLDENGRPRPVKGRGRYIVGLPLWKGGTAEAWNFWTHEQMSVKDFADSLDLMLQGDVVWMRDQLLAPLFYNGSGFAYSNVQTAESFTVYGLANGDTVVYQSDTGAATDTHYAAQAAAIDSTHNPLTSIYNDIVEHPDNSGRVVAFCATDQISAIELLPGFAPVDQFIINQVVATGDATTDPLFAPGLNLPLSRAMKFRGIHESMYIVEWPAIPSGYIVAVAVDATEKALAMREYAQPSLRGLINQGEPMSRFPWAQNNYVRAAGFGCRNRTGAYVLYAGTSGTYVAPTSLGFPLG
jgi:hypothetical protein